MAAYYVLLMTQRVNDAARATMLAYASGADLDQLAANFNVARKVIDPGDPDAIPPDAPTYESDEELRRRVQLSFEGVSVAGPVGAYIFHALGADPDVLDASVDSPAPGEVVVTVLSRQGDGTPSAELLAAVEAVLSAEDVRPLTDQVTVQAATVFPFAVTAALTLYEGPDAWVVRSAAENALAGYVARNHKLGRDVTRSGLFAALHQEGVQNVVLTEPAADIVVSASEVAYCTASTVTVEGVDD
ncbi:MAG: baseplate assembly protein [Rhodovulum sp.]